MENFKEFQGKDLDDCIDQARVFYGAPREKLEIEIIQDAKSGIFGIVGARKAKIRARKARAAESVLDLLEGAMKASPAHASDLGAEKQKKSRKRDAARQNLSRDAPARLPKTAASPSDMPDDGDDPFDGLTDSPLASFAELDKELLEKTAREIVGKLLEPIAGKELELSVEIVPGSVRIKAPWEGDAGLLIGREGQTLAAIQYMASRILARKMNSAVRVRLDIGDYRSRQEDKLCEMAKALAEKAARLGRPFSTRPLSSFHRRVIHLCLRDNEEIQTRSSGDGPLKKVLIVPRKNGRT
ncbi:MAG: Jag N-terminal domain-containing protein [Desulfovibrio sp.]|nr:Jag N-terminal domain-containing protein [Desulfovibrio sp.]